MTSYDLDDLLQLMARLRDPEDGCPWDRAQDFGSIVPHTIEESYELADAIARDNFQQIKEELGDVLFQVVFYSQLGKEQGRFSFDDIVTSLVSKLLRRHPHVFPDGSLQSRAGEQVVNSDGVKQSWEMIKSDERAEKKQHRIFDDVPLSLPALSRGNKLQKRAARVGFDWEKFDHILDKLKEELGELEEARAQGDTAAIEHEMGDILFCCVNMARRLDVDPESSLRACNRRFEGRFGYIEKRLEEKGLTPQQTSLDEMDQLWDEAKKAGL